MLKKQRLDLLLVEKGLFASREIARSAIMQGAILVDNNKIVKPGCKVLDSANITICNWFHKPKYVSRGGYKLEKALDYFQISVKDRICLDIGASTGGFTDCLLQHKASKIYAIDVGYGQIDWTLRQNPQVVLIERSNIRYLKSENLYQDNQIADFAVIDLSFISVTKIISALLNLLNTYSEIICLIKPQFETSKALVEKGGVIRKPLTQINAIENVIEKFKSANSSLINLTYSPIKGGAGNIEFLAYFKTNAQVDINSCLNIETIVKKAHEKLNVKP